MILNGALGAGKTTLTKGIAAAWGCRASVMSPTFVIARVHRPDAAHPSSVPLVHVDAYRLTGAVELDDLDLDTDLAARRGRRRVGRRGRGRARRRTG